MLNFLANFAPRIKFFDIFDSPIEWAFQKTKKKTIPRPKSSWEIDKKTKWEQVFDTPCSIDRNFNKIFSFLHIFIKLFTDMVVGQGISDARSTLSRESSRCRQLQWSLDLSHIFLYLTFNNYVIMYFMA